MSTEFSSLKDLVQQVNNSTGLEFPNEFQPSWTNWNNTILKTIKMFVWDYSGALSDSAVTNINELKAANLIIDFYKQWGNYLSPTSYVLVFMANILEGIAKVLYQMAYSLESIFKNMFKLFGIFWELDSSTSFIGQMYNYMQIVGISIFLLLLTIRIVSSFTGRWVRYQDVVNNFLLVTFSLFLLPRGIQEIAKVIVPAANATYQKGTAGENSLAIRPFQYNVTDLNVLIQYNFDTEKLGFNNKTGFIDPNQTKENIKLNNISDASMRYLDLTEYYGVNNKDDIQKFVTVSEGNLDSPYYGVATLLTTEPASYNTTASNIEALRTIKMSNLSGGLFGINVYSRYTTNWIPLYFQLILIIIILISMSVNVVRAIYSVLIESIAAPIVGYTNVEDSSKFKEVLHQVVAGVSGIIFEVIMFFVAYFIMTNYSSIRVDIPGVSGGTFSESIGGWENVISSIVVYLGCFLGVIQGSGSIKRWLGISTSHAVAGALTAAAAIPLARSLGDKASHPVRTAKEIGRGVGSVGKGIGNAAANVKSAFKETGAKNLGTFEETAAKGIGEDSLESMAEVVGTQGSYGSSSASSMKHTDDDSPLSPTNSRTDEASPVAPTDSHTGDVPPLSPTDSYTGDVPPVSPTDSYTGDVPPLSPTNSYTCDVPPVAPTNSRTEDVSSLSPTNSYTGDIPPVAPTNSRTDDISSSGPIISRTDDAPSSGPIISRTDNVPPVSQPRSTASVKDERLNKLGDLPRKEQIDIDDF